jgi:Asp-tRNA(Asn)/Glu-tRNA(Gln) amidotransferase A subunit family amidase
VRSLRGSWKGLPIGVQLLGRENDEATLLALGAQMEAAADGEWTEQRPGA